MIQSGLYTGVFDMVCICSQYHLEQCSNCYREHYESDTVSFTDSAIVDKIVDYLHRFSLPGKPMGSYYYPLIKENAFTNKLTEFYLKNLLFVNYLFENKSTEKMKQIFHRAIKEYIGKYDGYSIAQGLDDEHLIKWRIVNGPQ